MPRAIVKRANFLSLAAVALLAATVSWLTWDRFNTAQDARAWVRHTYEVLGTSQDLRLAITEAQNDVRGYLLTGSDADLGRYGPAADQVMALHGALERLTQDNPAQQARLRDLEPLLRQRLDRFAAVLAARHNDGAEAAVRLIGSSEGRLNGERIRALLGDFTTEESRLLDLRLAASGERERQTRWLGLGGATLALLLLGMAARLTATALTQRGQAETAHRSAAEKLRGTLDSLSQGVGMFGPAHDLVDWNDCFGTLLDLPAPLLQPGTPYRALQVLTGADGQPLLEDESRFAHAHPSAGAAIPIVYERATEAGHTLELRRTSLPSGGFVLTISDMTERVRSEQVLRQAQKMEAIGHLTGGVAHDFNNLLTVVLGNLEYVRTRIAAETPLATRIDRAMWAAQRGATLTSHLLAFARRMPLAPQPTDLSATVPALLPLLQRTLGEHIDIRFVDAAGLWPVLVDAAQLESAVLNLCLNARDAMPGGGRLTIELANKVLDHDYARAHAEVTPGDYAMVAVSDTGHGMSPDVLARVFEPFFSTKPVGQGTGLGLAMVFGFVKQSGGHVKIYSESGQGTTVKIYLPRAVGARVPGAGRRNPADLPAGSGSILLVEDDTGVREVTATMLRDLGYRVVEAGNGDEALRVAAEQREHCDLLLLDVVLPGEPRGRALAERLAAVWPGVQTLYMSGYTENAIVHQGRLDDGVALIGKPFQREQLARRIAELLGKARDARGTHAGNVVPLKARRPEAG